MNKKEQMIFAQRVSILISSGISLGEALLIISRMEKGIKKKKILIQIQENVEKGHSLSKSILSTKAHFDSTLLMMVRNGESSGTLPISLKQAQLTLEKTIELKKKLIGTLIYPTFIALATVGMALFLVMFIFPKIIPLLTSMNITLPLLTRMVRKMYELLVQYGIWGIILIIIFSFLFYFLYKKVLFIRTKVQNLILSLPLIGNALKKYFISTYFRSSGMLLSHGQSLVSILDEASQSNTYEAYKKSWKKGALDVSKGVALSESLKTDSKLFPTLVVDMLSIGERTGALSEMFEHVSKMYEEELDQFIKQFSTIIEPVLMIGMGLVVGSIALSIILPIYEITNHLSPK